MAGEERESLVEIVEGFKASLMDHATGGSIDTQRYAAARKSILGATQIADLVPKFVKAYRTPGEFWNFIKNEFPTYKERRTFLAAQLNPLIERLERNDVSLTAAFMLGERLGSGGYGTVYRVKHDLLGMDFAVKVFEPVFDDGNQPDLDRFFREARVLFHLHHPNIIRVHDAGLIGKKPFIRMECFEGDNLNTFLQKRGVLTSEKAAVLIRKMASAMSHAHERGVVHRDIKPSNVMLAAREEVRIVDFGLGAFVEAELVSRITKTGHHAVGGYYSAPELVAEPKLLHPATDVYSIGAVWFTALTGRPPAGSDLHLRLDELAKSEPLLPILRKALASSTNRYKSATALLEALVSSSK